MQYFDKFSRKEPVNSPFWKLYDSADYKSLLRFTKTISGKYILDFACGDGRNTSTISKKSNFIIGVDVSHQSIQSAASHNEKGNINFIVCDGSKLPFQEAVFSAAIVVDALHHFKSISTPLKEISRVLNKENAGLYVKDLLYSPIVSISESLIRFAPKFIKQKIPEFSECDMIPHTNGVMKYDLLSFISSMNFVIIRNESSSFLLPYLVRGLFIGPFRFLEKSDKLASILYKADKQLGQTFIGRFPRSITISSNRNKAH